MSIYIYLFYFFNEALIVYTLRDCNFAKSADNIGKPHILRAMRDTCMALIALPNLTVRERFILKTMQNLTHNLPGIKALIYLTDRASRRARTTQKTMGHTLTPRLSRHLVFEVIVG